MTLDAARELHRAGRFEEAAAAYRELLEGGSLDDDASASASNNLCLVLDALGDLEAAEEACRTALALRRGMDDRLRLARALNNLGLVLQHRGTYSEAEELFSEALAVNREINQPSAQAINLANLGAVATLAGRFQEALELNRAVRELAGRHGDEPWAKEQARIAQLNRGVVLERLGAHREALEVYGALLDQNAELRADEEASILTNSGVIYANLGDPVQAIERFEAAAAIYESVGDLSGLAHTQVNIGLARHVNLGDPSGAETAYRRALELVGRSGDRWVELEALGSLGRLLLVNGRSEEARDSFARGLALARASGSSEGIWASLAGLGEVERAAGELETALEHFEQAIALIEEERADVERPEYRASFLADKRAVYSAALGTLAELDRLERGGRAGRALEVAQQAKARDLLDALELKAGAPEALGAIMRPVAAGELAHRVGRDVLVEYFVAEDELLMWWSDAGSLRMASLGDPRGILEATETVHRTLANGSEPAPALVELLSSELLGPLGALPSDAENLWIAPDRLLRYLPFEVLSAPGEPAARLVERLRVSYLPSAWALAGTASRGGTRRELGFVGFGGVDGASLARYPAWVSRLALEPLPAARDELASVARRVSGESRVFTGPEATEAAFRSHAGMRPAVLHFATHSALAEDVDRETAILLTPEGSDDGLLSPSEIASSSVEATLVVLAACATALGGEEDGRAMTTLTGSFLAAGSNAVLATLWPVGDQPTAVFMDQFYFQLAKGVSPAEALRRTKLILMEDDRWGNPSLWSGYVLVGSAPALTGEWSLWRLGVLAMLASAALLAALAMRAARARTR
ncbi:MAG: CHAT domain-containing protein [Thermoanaerobaculia bacterium]